MAHRSALGIAALVVLSFAAAAGGGTGCGSDDSGSGGTSDAASGTGASGSTSTSTTTAGGGGMCGQGMVDPNDACEVCSSMKCMSEAVACCEKPGCLELIDCVRKTGCSTDKPLDPGGCFTPDADGGCMDEINTATLPVAQGEATKLGDCARTNCPMECGLMGTGGAGGGSGGAGGG